MECWQIRGDGKDAMLFSRDETGTFMDISSFIVWSPVRAEPPYEPSYAQTDTNARRHKNTHANINRIYTHRHTRTKTKICQHNHTYTPRHTRANTVTHTHKHTHANTHTNAHASAKKHVRIDTQPPNQNTHTRPHAHYRHAHTRQYMGPVLLWDFGNEFLPWKPVDWTSTFSLQRHFISVCRMNITHTQVFTCKHRYR